VKRESQGLSKKRKVTEIKTNAVWYSDDDVLESQTVAMITCVCLSFLKVLLFVILCKFNGRVPGLVQ
jgi:hypothetical protein